jgi:Periplasmic binding protein
MIFTLVLFATIQLPSTTHAETRDRPPAGLPREDIIRLGQQIYRDGILPSGNPVEAVIKNDIPVSGAFFSCVSCHLRSGLGSVEGNIITPPATGNKLYKPYYTGPELSEAKRATIPKYFQPLLQRPAYTDESLAEALRSCIDPSGRLLNPVMPCYSLHDPDMAILISYLKLLSAEYSPGVSETTISFATIITDDVSPGERDAMLTPLQNYITARNNQFKVYKTRSRYVVNAEEMNLAYRRFTLAVWELKGPPETWRKQLEAYYRKEPVFALVGGMTDGEWKPIHQFSEDNHIPCFFPLTDFPVVSEKDWYTMYLSKGFYQEGESAARFLNGRYEQLEGRAVVQIVDDSPTGRALTEGFRKTWHEVGRHEPVTITLNKGETLSGEFLRRVLAKEKPAAVLLWSGPDALPALESLAAEKKRPEILLASSSYLGKGFWSLAEKARDVTYLTYPYRLPQDETRFKVHTMPLITKKNPEDAEIMIAKKTYAIIRLMTQIFMHMQRNYYRDYFFDVVGMLPDQVFPLYERLSFGPGQRYASKGCYIVQLSGGNTPELIRKSDWVIY